MFKKLEEQVNLIHKQGSVSDPCTKAAELNVLLKNGDGSKSTVFYDVTWEKDYRGNPMLNIRASLTKSKKAMDKAFKSSGINGMDYEMLDTIINPSEASSIFDSYIDYIITDIGSKAPFYANLLEDCIWEETDNNHQVNTLAVSWDRTNKRFRLYYNPSFILKGALAQYLYAKKEYLSLEECYVYMTKFYLIHEMSHITRSHMFSQNSDLLKDVSPQNVNIYGDSFINQTIPDLVLKERKPTPPVIGIINEISKKGIFKLSTARNLLIQFDMCLNHFTNAVALTKDATGGDVYMKDKEALVIFRMGDILTNANIGQGNSGLFIKAINDFFNKILGPQSQNMNYDNQDSTGGDTQDSQANQSDGGSNTGGQGDNSQQSQGNDSQDNQSPSDNSQDDKQGQENSSQDKQNKEGDGTNQDVEDGSSDGMGDKKTQDSQGQASNKDGDNQEDDLKTPDGESKDKSINTDTSNGKSKSSQNSSFEDTDFDDIVSQLQQQNNASQKDKMKTEEQAEENENGEPKPKDPSDNEDIEIKELSKEEKKAAKDLVDKALKKDTSKNLSKMFGEEGLSEITGKRVNVESKSVWRKALSKAVSQTLGIKEEWDSNAVSARIEGELGREVEKPNLSSILIMIDCSGSMGPQTFKKVLQEVLILEKIFKDKPTVHVVFWGSTSYYKKYKLDKNLYKRVTADASNLGGTNYITALPFAQAKVKNPDLIIDCTDFEYTLDAGTIRSRKKWNKKTIWVAAPGSRLEVLKKLDPAYKKRFIKLR